VLVAASGTDVKSAMKKLRYSATVNAPVQDVWTTMLDEASYREWTRVFGESSYEGDWNQGSEIRFVGPDGDGSVGGLIATVEENRPHELISLRYIGQIVNGEVDTTSAAAKAFIGAHERYTFSESGGSTTVDVELDSDEEYVAMFDDAWPLALEKLKEMVEARS
jgi:uncharacterized protein YndB with AHSA1/START domain